MIMSEAQEPAAVDEGPEVALAVDAAMILNAGRFGRARIYCV